MNTIRTRTRRGAAILFSGILVLGGLALTGEASAGQVVEGNPTCPVGYEFAEKQEREPQRDLHLRSRRCDSHHHGGHLVRSRGSSSTQQEQRHQPSYSVPGTDYRIIVKGGNGAIIYSPGERAARLYAPTNASDKWPTISHFQLCWNTPEPQPEVGQLEVTKAVVGTDTPDEYTFEICVTPVEAEGAAVCKEVVGKGTLTFDNLPPGEYVVTETDPGFELLGRGFGRHGHCRVRGHDQDHRDQHLDPAERGVR